MFKANSPVVNMLTTRYSSIYNYKLVRFNRVITLNSNNARSQSLLIKHLAILRHIKE